MAETRPTDAEIIGDDSMTISQKLAELRKTHQHSEDELEEMHGHFEKIYADTNHGNMFNNVKGKIGEFYIHALEHRRRKLNILQAHIENELTNLEFNRDTVNHDLLSLVDRIERECLDSEFSGDYPRAAQNSKAVVNKVYPPGWLNRMGKRAGSAVVAPFKIPGKILGFGRRG